MGSNFVDQFQHFLVELLRAQSEVYKGDENICDAFRSSFSQFQMVSNEVQHFLAELLRAQSEVYEGDENISDAFRNSFSQFQMVSNEVKEVQQNV